MGPEPVNLIGQPIDDVVLAGWRLLSVQGPHRRGEVVEDAPEFACGGGRGHRAAGEQDRRTNQLQNGRSHCLRLLPSLGIVSLNVRPH